MPRNEQENVPNNENNNPNNGPVMPEAAANQMGLDGEEGPGEAYIPPVPPEVVEEPFENLNINAELNARNGEPALQEDVPGVQGQPGNTYRNYVATLKKSGYTDRNVAHLIAASIMMQSDPNAGVNWNALEELASRLKVQPAFARLMSDPETRNLVSAGDGVALIEKLAAVENERRNELDQYGRPAEYAYDDSLFLTAVKENLRDKEDGYRTPGAGLNREDKLYQEMIKQIEHAESLAEKGLPLSGDDSKKLINAVKKYNDGGTKTPGGTHKAAGFTEAMCILKRYMPEREFLSYCERINARTKTKIDPESFTDRRMYGYDLSVADMKKRCRTDLENDLTLENCAALVACAMAPSKNGLIDVESYEAQKAKLLQDGSAFRRAMDDEAVQKKVVSLVQSGSKANKIISAISDEATNHLGKTAQWQYNRSRQALIGGRTNTYVSGEHLANIMALHRFSLSAGIADQVTNKSFAERAEEIKADPIFRRMADRYASDPEYRNHINSKLKEDGTGASLTEEYGRLQRNMNRKARQVQQQQQQVPEAGA